MSPPTWPGKGGLKEAPSVRPAAVTASGAHPHTHRTPSPALTAAPHSNLAKGPGASPQGFPPALPAPPRPAAPRAPPLPQQKEQGSFQKHKHPSAGKWNSPSTPVPCGSRSRHFHLPGPAGGAPPPGEDGSARLPSAGRNPRASMEGPARHLHTHARAPPHPAMDGSSRPPWGRTMAGAKSRFVPTFARLPLLPGASLLRRLPQRRVRARCPGTGGLRPGSAPM